MCSSDLVYLNGLRKQASNQPQTTYAARTKIVLNEGFTISSDDPAINLEITDGDKNAPMVAGYYIKGELSKATVTDEDGKVTEEFKNKSGQVILKRAKVDATTWAETYYTYDDFGRLRYVLPPEAVKLLNTYPTPEGQWNFLNATVAEQLPGLWYRYYYDGRGRMISKEVPGAGKVTMVYDRRDRLVLSQDAHQRQRGEWSFTKYDELNRPVITGLHTSSETRAQLQTALDAQFGNTGYQPYESFDSTRTEADDHLYTNQSFPTTGLNIHSVTYYDNYAWKKGQTNYDYDQSRSEERRVGKECRSRWSPYH